MATQPIDDTSANDAALEAVETVVDADAAEAPQLSDVERLATELGWKPKGYKDEGKKPFKSAEDWILDTGKMKDSFSSNLRDLKHQMDVMVRTGHKMTERALREQAQEIEARYNQAFDSGDKRGAAQAVRDMENLQREATPADPNVTERDFASRNSWYGKDEEATAYAITVSQREAAKGKSLDEQLGAVEVAMKKRFPELYEDSPARPAAKPQAQVNAPSRGAPAAARQDFASMPSAMRQAAENYAKLFVDKGFFTDKDAAIKAYVKDYWAEQAKGV